MVETLDQLSGVEGDIPGGEVLSGMPDIQVSLPGGEASVGTPQAEGNPNDAAMVDWWKGNRESALKTVAHADRFLAQAALRASGQSELPFGDPLDTVTV